MVRAHTAGMDVAMRLADDACLDVCGWWVGYAREMVEGPLDGLLMSRRLTPYHAMISEHSSLDSGSLSKNLFSSENGSGGQAGPPLFKVPELCFFTI